MAEKVEQYSGDELSQISAPETEDYQEDPNDLLTQKEIGIFQNAFKFVKGQMFDMHRKDLTNFTSVLSIVSGFEAAGDVLQKRAKEIGKSIVKRRRELEKKTGRRII